MELKINVDPSIYELFPQACISVIWVRFPQVHHADNKSPWVGPKEDSVGNIEVWHNAYRAMGVNPKRNRPSSDALYRRWLRDGALPRINPIVDLYNGVSLTYLVPVGAYDEKKIQGNHILLTRAGGDEYFFPMTKDSNPEKVSHGEIIYKDTQHVLTRYWNYRDGISASVDNGSTSILFFTETPGGSLTISTLETVLDTIGYQASLLGAAEIGRCHLTASSPEHIFT